MKEMGHVRGTLFRCLREIGTTRGALKTVYKDEKTGAKKPMNPICMMELFCIRKFGYVSHFHTGRMPKTMEIEAAF